MLELKEALKNANLPTTRSEDYRYTSLRDVHLERQAELSDSISAIPAEYLEKDDRETAVLAHQAGSQKILGLEDLPKGIIQGEASLLKEFGELPDYMADDPFARLAVERAQNITILRVTKDYAGGLVRILNYFSPEIATCLYRTLIVVDENVSFSAAEELVGRGFLNGQAPLACGLVQLVALSGSQLKFQSVQNFGSSAQVFQRLSIMAHQDARVEVTPVCLGGAKTQLRSELDCVGRGSTIDVVGAARGDESQHFDFWAVSRHDVTDTRANTEFWTVMADQARTVFNGNIVISQKGMRTDASQKNKNMLLSKKARVSTIPKLEISTDDVKCAHGAAVVPINEDQVYYLQARGISRHDAQLMIINGFTHPVVKRLESGALFNRVSQAIQDKHSLQAQRDEQS